MRSASASTSRRLVHRAVLCAACLLLAGCESSAPPTSPLRAADDASVATAPGPAASASSATPSVHGASTEPTPRTAGSGDEQPNAAVRALEAWPVLEAPEAAHSFCPERLRALAEDACFALPPKPTTTLLIYLHGIVPPTRVSVQKTNLAEVVANASERAGVVALLPRGEQGFSPPTYPRWWGWPTGKLGYESHATPLIDRLRKRREALEQLLGVRFERAYLAGSSSGAYFVASVLLHGSMPEVDGYGVLSGGSGYSTPMLATLPKRPVYFGFGQYDSVAPPVRALAARLEAEGWPVKLAAHPEGHGAREVYLDEAFAFWRRPEPR